MENTTTTPAGTTTTPAGTTATATVITLPSGAKAEIRKFKGKDVRRATAMTNGDTSLYLFALIALCTKIDGKGIVMEEIDEMDGADVLALMGQFGENFQPAQVN